MITFASSNKKKNNMDEKSKIPTPVISLIPLFVLVALLAMVIHPYLRWRCTFRRKPSIASDRFVRMCRHSHDKIRL